MKHKMENKNIKIFAFPRSIFGERDVKIFREIGYTVEVCNLPNFFFPFKFYEVILPLSQWFKLYKKLKDVDIFFAWWAISLDVVLLSKIFRKPCIIVAGGGEVETSKNVPREYSYAYANSSPYKKLVTKLTLKFADKVISVSNYAKENADKIAKNPTNEVVYNGINTEIFKPLNVEKKPYILTTGYQKKTVVKRKGFLELLEAFAKLSSKHPDYMLVFLGEDHGGRKIIKKKVDVLGLKNKVIFIELKLKNKYTYNLKSNYGQHMKENDVDFEGKKECKDDYSSLCEADIIKNDEEYVKFINSCKIYVQYSSHEMFGVALCEAMACGIPVIASNKSALPEVVGDAGLIADRENTNDLVKKIEMLINDTNLYNELSKKGVERVRNNFSKEIRKQKLKKIVEELVKRRKK